MAASFQGMISALQAFWEEQGCVIVVIHTSSQNDVQRARTVLAAYGAREMRRGGLRLDRGDLASSPLLLPLPVLWERVGVRVI